ncbi:MAG: hypothetical protein M3540_00420 [Actinomycetota bacterium]|nr:hypothetical protein [Actinomycetota bacterium]
MDVLRRNRRNRGAGRTFAIVAMLAPALIVSGCRHGNDSISARKTIPQPVVEGIRVAPESERVDLASPTFSDPTDVSNALFPVSKQASVLLLGRVDGKPFRTEVTLLPETRIIEWQGQKVETLVSQYVAYLGGRIHEVAYDFYAQDDNGAVWYFGEDVFNFKDGLIADTHGTWIAGKDGPAAMIMPADPQVGDVYRPENIPGFVFEEVTVKAVGRRLEGPLGSVNGGLVIEEVHMDNSKERKTFAPGYGEFFTAGGGDVEALALAVPTDALSEPAPAELLALESGAADVFGAAQSGNWKAAQATVKKMTAAWETVRAGEVPDRLEPQMSGALEALADGIRSRKAPEARQAAIHVARWSLDLQLRHRPVTEIDRARFDLWAAQLLVDAAAGDAAAVNGDFFSLDYIRDRIQHTLKETDLTRFNAELEELNGAVADEDFSAVAAAAGQLRETLAGFKPPG